MQSVVQSTTVGSDPLPPSEHPAPDDALQPLSLDDQPITSVASSTAPYSGRGKQRSTPDPILNDLNTEARQRIITAIDRLHELGVNNDVSLPRLVVVGDQSSGKSSLLEGLTDVAFPIASGLCTRFVTHVSMKHAAGVDGSLRVFITPGQTSHRDPPHAERLRAFERVMNQSALSDRSDMDALFAEVSVLMGLAPNEEEISAPLQQFSDDILEIEFNGPAQTHLSVIDMPGLFHNPTHTQTEADRAFILKAIKRYIADENTIILAVMNASNNLVNQQIFNLAKEADPKGERIVGIMTKCDTVQKGDEPGVLKIAQNLVEVLHHGWFAVRNRSTEDIQSGTTIAQRHEEEEKFFHESCWNTLDKSRCGVKALKTYLAQILYEQIRLQLPRIIEDLDRLYKKFRHDLEAMGESRQTADAQRRYLARFAHDYEKLLEDSLSGHYKTDLTLFSPLRLETRLLHLREEFRRQMIKTGHKRAFMRPDNKVDESYIPFSFFPEPSSPSPQPPKKNVRVSLPSVPVSPTPICQVQAFMDADGVGGVSQRYHSISCCIPYRFWSPEELRLSGSTVSLTFANDHPQTNGLSTTQAVPSNDNPFGVKSSDLWGGGQEDSNSLPATSSGNSIFSKQPFTSSVSSGGLFGSQPTNSAANKSDTSPPSLFAKSGPLPATSTGGNLFSHQPPSTFGGGLFGSKPAKATSATSPSANSIFGPSAASKSKTSSSPGTFNGFPPLNFPREDIYQWILDNFRSSRGMELPGTVNPELVKTLFQQQTQSWKGISEEYVANVAMAVRSYTLEAHDKLVIDGNIRLALQKRHLEHEETMKYDASQELQRVLTDEYNNLTTVNQTYIDSLTQMREERVLCRLKSLGLLGEGKLDLEAKVNLTNVRSILKAANPSWEEQAVHDVHDILKAYYEVARDRFMDFVTLTVVKRHLVGEASKLKLYDSTYATRLTDHELAEIVGESPASVRNRGELLRKTAMFKQAIEVTKNL